MFEVEISLGPGIAYRYRGGRSSPGRSSVVIGYIFLGAFLSLPLL